MLTLHLVYAYKWLSCTIEIGFGLFNIWVELTTALTKHCSCCRRMADYKPETELRQQPLVEGCTALLFIDVQVCDATHTMCSSKHTMLRRTTTVTRMEHCTSHLKKYSLITGGADWTKLPQTFRRCKKPFVRLMQRYAGEW